MTDQELLDLVKTNPEAAVVALLIRAQHLENILDILNKNVYGEIIIDEVLDYCVKNGLLLL